MLLFLILFAAAAAPAGDPGHDPWNKLFQDRAAYRQQLDAVRREEGGVRKLPPVSFFFFGMGHRRKMLYRQGVLTDVGTRQVIRRWDLSAEIIVPPSCTVALKTRDSDLVTLVEDEEAVWLQEGGKRTPPDPGACRSSELRGASPSVGSPGAAPGIAHQCDRWQTGSPISWFIPNRGTGMGP